MQNLAPYSSNLTQFYYDELLSLYQQAVANGAYAGGTLSAATQIAALVSASQSFSQLSTPSAGNVATDDSFNNPINLLQAQLSAIASEIAAFNAVFTNYTLLAAKETILLDNLLAGAQMANNLLKYFPIVGATSSGWDFRIDSGLIDGSLTNTDPSSGVAYPSSIETKESYALSGSTVTEQAGIQGAIPDVTVPIEDLSWLFTTAGQSEPLTSADWATLSILEDNPRVSYNNQPTVSILLPNNGNIAGLFNFTGTAAAGTPNIYVKTQFVPRFNSNNTIPSAVSSNLCLDPNFTNGNWTLNSWVHDTSDESTLNVPSVAKAASGAGILTSPLITSRVQPGQPMYIQFWSQNSSTANGILQANMVFFDNSGTQVGSTTPVRMAQPITGPQLVDGVITVPNNPAIVSGKLQISISTFTTGNWYVYGVNIQGPLLISNWVINPDSVVLYSLDNTNRVFTQNVDYVVTSENALVFLDIKDSAPGFGAQFTEYYPAYSCSMDNATWSQIVMLDPLRIYPDTTTVFTPVAMGGAQRTLFPITDELGEPSGIYMTMIGVPQTNYVLNIGVGASQVVGFPSSLKMQLGHTSYISAVYLEPLSGYPSILTGIQIVGLAADNPSIVFTGNVLIDRPMELTFPRQVARSITLIFNQVNYTIKTHAIDPPDALRRNILTQLQNSIPFADQWNLPAEIDYYSGVQYDVGFAGIKVYDRADSFPQVIVAGPIRFNGVIDLLRFDAEIQGTVNCYLCYRTFSVSGEQIDQNLTGTSITPNSTIVFPYGAGIKANTGYVEVSFKYVLEDLTSSVGLYNLQAVLT